MPIKLVLHVAKTDEQENGETTARIGRIVGSSLAYVKLRSGQGLAIGADDIDGYRGETFGSLGIREGASIQVKIDPLLSHGAKLFIR